MFKTRMNRAYVHRETNRLVLVGVIVASVLAGRFLGNKYGRPSASVNAPVSQSITNSIPSAPNAETNYPGASEIKVYSEFVRDMETDMRRGFTNSTLILAEDTKADIRQWRAENSSLGRKAYEESLELERRLDNLKYLAPAH